MSSPTPSLRVMTYNIRMDTAQDGQNQWSHRRQRVINLLLRYSPDLFGVQEALSHQMTDLQAGLPDFDAYGVGRDDGKSRGECSAVFYRRDRLKLIDQGTFWLSETPDIVGSRGWDAALPRICSWVKLKDRSANTELCYFNTHLDHKGHKARRESAHLLVARIQSIAGSTTPAILTGDFNEGPDSDTYRAVTTRTMLQDARLLSEARNSGPNGTWSTFDVNHGIGDRIDYVFITPLHFKVLQHTHVTESKNGFYPSDHLPVFTELLLLK